MIWIEGACAIVSACFATHTSDQDAGAITQDGTSAAMFEQSFEGQSPIESFHRVHRADRFSVVPDPLEESNSVVRVDVPKDEHYGGALHVDFAKLVHDGHLDAEPTRAYFRYRLYFDQSWTTPIGGKLPGFGGTYNIAGWGGKPSNGINGWSARGMFGGIDNNGHIPIGSYVYHADMVEQGQKYGTGMWWGESLKHGRWYTIEQELTLNTLNQIPETDTDDQPEHERTLTGNSDGRLRAWIDGELVFDQQGLHLRDTDELRIETIWLNIYEGGKTPAPSSMFLLMDDVYVSINRNDDHNAKSDSDL
ncbi:MAG: polysaccharide lyase [Phycisphaerales bacterium]